MALSLFAIFPDSVLLRYELPAYLTERPLISQFLGLSLLVQLMGGEEIQKMSACVHTVYTVNASHKIQRTFNWNVVLVV